MNLAVALLGVFIAVLGAGGIVSPQRLLGLVGRLQTPSGLYLIAGIRLLGGVALLFAAPGSRAPAYLQIFGVLAIVSGIVTPFFGLRRFEVLMRWWRARPTPVLRIWCALVVLIGTSLLWAVFPELGAA